jgi:hypothetical protein
MTEARYKALLTAAYCNFSAHSSDGVSKEQRDAEFAATEKEWDDAKTSLTPEALEEWHAARMKEHGANCAELMVALRSELDALLLEFDDLFGDSAAIIIKKQ